MDISNSTIYARVENGVITEYPVYDYHIVNRGEPIDWYTPVHFSARPVIPPFHYAREIPTIVGTEVHVSYVVEALDLNALLRHISPQDLMFSSQITPANIADIDPEAIARIKQLVTIHVQQKLDAFAQEKGYDNLLAAISYKDSTVVQFSTEATTAIQLRDQVWNGLYAYFEQVIDGTQPVPTSIQDIESYLPAFTWA